MNIRKIEVIIRPERLSNVTEALRQLGYPGMTISEVRGHGKQGGLTQQWRGREYKIEFLPKIKIEMVIPDNGEKLEEILEAIAEAASLGKVGDGKIFIWPIEDVMRIRTRERGPGAV